MEMMWRFLAVISLASAYGAPITYNRDIAPILNRRCVSCHRADEAGPFPLTSYSDAAKRAPLIAQVTASRYMPPWKPEPGYGDFEGARSLTQAEIDTIGRWARAGAPQGSPADLPPLPATRQTKLAQPDLTVQMPQPFTVPVEG